MQNLIRKAVSVLIGLAIAALLVEALARLFFPHWSPRTGSLTAFWRHDPLLGWAHMANSSGSFDSHGFRSAVKINSKGFRDVERTYDGDRSKYRVVVLGDSMVWGWGVQQDETFTALLEKQCPHIEALNLAVSGYGTDQELLLYRQEAVRYHPQLVVVVVMENDFGTNIRQSVFLGYGKPLFQFDAGGHLVLTNTPVPEPSIWARLASIPMRYSYVLNQTARAYEQIKLWRTPRNSTTTKPNAASTFPLNSEEALTAALLLEIQEEATKAGAELLLVLTDGLGGAGRRMEEYFRSKHIRALNLDDAFPSDMARELHLPDGVHWTAFGHQRVADSLLRYLKRENLGIPPSGALPPERAVPTC